MLAWRLPTVSAILPFTYYIIIKSRKMQDYGTVAIT